MTSDRARLTRRNLLIGAASAVVVVGGAVIAVDQRILPGRSTMFEVLGLDGPAGTIPKIDPGPMTTGTFVSAARLGKRCGWAVSYPPGSRPGDKLPVLVALHGYSDNHLSAFGADLGLDRFLAQAVKNGAAPFAIASVDGGNTYWHKRASGENASAMVTDEFLPLLGRHGLDVGRIGLLGWSMGGYGALLIGGRLGPDRVASIAAESPALWLKADQAAHGAFDGPADFAANKLFGRQHELSQIPVRIDCGTGDGFCPVVRSYVSGMVPRPAGGFEPGGHNMAYWRRLAPAQLAFVDSHFA